VENVRWRCDLPKVPQAVQATVMRFRLRTLLIVLAVGPVVLAGAWFGWQALVARPQTDDLTTEVIQLDAPAVEAIFIDPQPIQKASPHEK
jgi:hypothetical protein